VDERLEAELELAAVPHEELARRLYRLALRREPEPEALTRAVTRLTDGTLSRAALLQELVGGDEFALVRALDDAVAFAAWARSAGERPRELRGPADCDERVIEIPWTLSRYRGEPHVLDVGFANAIPVYLRALREAVPGEVVGVDLAEADVPGIRGIVADLRDLPFEVGSFDVVFCISTVEHVGADNTRYGTGSGGGGIEAALAELSRVLGEHGRLLITVPCGPEEDLGWYVRLPPEQWRRRFETAGFAIHEDEVYGRTTEGWRAVDDAEGDCLCAELVQRGVLASFRRVLRRGRR
jgi:SAM-dependent methyltransferase